MARQLKPLDQRVIVITTGASSGIGLAAAVAATHQGPRLVLAARSEPKLDDIVASLRGHGGDAICVRADVGERADVERIAAAAIERYGRVDTWVNDVGVSIYGRLDTVSDEDSQRMFQTDFWGVVSGSLVAPPHLRRQGRCADQHRQRGVGHGGPAAGLVLGQQARGQGFTDALRIELEADAAPMSVTLIQPTAVGTPYAEHAGNYLDQEPEPPSPMIEVERVAAAILDAATTATANSKVGAMSGLDTTMAKLVPARAGAMAKMQIGGGRQTPCAV